MGTRSIRHGPRFVAIAVTIAAVLPAEQAASGAASVNEPSRVAADRSLSIANDVAVAVDRLGRQADYATIYGGVVEDDPDATVNVYLTTPAPGVEDAFRSLGNDSVHVAFVHTAHSLTVLDKLHDQVTNDSHSLEAEGINLSSWFPDVRRGAETIQVIDLTAAQALTLHSRFGDAIHVVGISAADAPQVSADRLHDAAPHNGGSAVTDYANGGCSSAFPVTRNGLDAMLGASHCFVGDPTGQDIFNELLPNSGATGSNAHIGDFDTRETGSGTGDTGVYDTTAEGGSSARIWTGVIGSPVLKTVGGTSYAVNGTPICNEGAYSGEICGITTQFTDVCVNYTDFRQVCHLDYANTAEKCYDSCIANQAGDSGGPIVRPDGSSKVYATGIDSGHAGDPVQCQYNNTACWASMYFVPIEWALQGTPFGLSLKTG